MIWRGTSIVGLFLATVEASVGRERFDRFLREYFDTFAFQSMDTRRFVAYLQAHLLDRTPGLAQSLSGLAPALIAVGGFDPLRDEGQSYAEALRAAGTPVDLRYMGSLTHGFTNLFRLGGGSATGTSELISALRAHLSRV